ncbi:MAG: ATP-binding protein [bacterium]|nr:ATP-binding protein [bacterium]
MFFAGLTSCNPRPDGIGAPRVLDGVLDLRGWNFQDQGPIELNGDWEFYWRRFVPPNQFAGNASGFASSTEAGSALRAAVPGKWNQQTIDGRRFSSDGFATYHMRILLNPSQIRNSDTIPIFAFRLRRIYTAYRLYVNGTQIVQVARPAESAEEARPGYRIVLKNLAVTEPVLDVVLHISNYSHPNAGLPVAILFGTETNIRAEREARLAFDLFLIGGLLVLGIYQLGLYLLSRVDRAPVLLGVFCLIVAVRHLIDDERYVDDLFQGIPWIVLHRMAYAAFTLAVIVMLEHVHRFFEGEAVIWITRSLQTLSAAFLLLVIFFSPKVYSAHAYLFEIVAVLSGLYLIIVVIIATVRKRNESLMSVASLLCLVPGMVNKILFDSGHWAGLDLLPLGLFGFLMMQTLVVSRRFSRSFISIEKSSKELEVRVADRTRELQEFGVQLEEARDRAEDSNRAKSEFLATMSHEIRTPLNAIIGTSQLLREDSLSEEDRAQYVSVLGRAGDNLLRLVNQVLDFSRLEEGQMRLSRVGIAPAKLLREVVEIMEIQARAKGLEIEREVAIDDARLFLGDPDRIKQILLNLMGNAVKFTAAGRIIARLAVSEDRGAQALRFEIEDDGPGIPSEKIAQMFERFTQVDSSDSRRFEGTGLGLAITKKLVDLMQGDIAYTVPRSGRGSCFIVTLPLPGIAESADAIAPSPVKTERAAQATEPPAKLRVLLAEDNEDNVLLIRAFLKKSDLILDVAVDGQEALANFQAAVAAGGDALYDIVLMDIQMPRMDGYTATKKIREYERAAGIAATPIIALTANATAEDVQRSKDASCDEHLSKPVLKPLLLKTLNEFTRPKNADI